MCQCTLSSFPRIIMVMLTVSCSWLLMCFVVCVCFFCLFVCHVPLCTIRMTHNHGSCVYTASSRACLFVCVYVCALPALLLNNPAYHLLLSDHRNGSRPLVVPSTTQAQEKSLNVPQGKRPQAEPTQSGGAATTLPTYLLTSLTAEIWLIYFACVWPSSLPPVTHIISHSHSLTTKHYSRFVCGDGLVFGELYNFFKLNPETNRWFICLCRANTFVLTGVNPDNCFVPKSMVARFH